MIELQAPNFSRVLPLYADTGRCFPLILAVLRGLQRGQVFADDDRLPKSAVVVTHCGFMMCLGSDQGEGLGSPVAEILSRGSLLHSNYLLWYDPPEVWKTRLNRVLPKPVRRRDRIRFELSGPRELPHGEQETCPAGFELRELDVDLLPATENLGVSIVGRFWATATDFSMHGLGTCLVRNGVVVSVCYSACVVDGLAEVDIATLPEFQGQGLATIVGREFVRLCIRRGVTPTWDCFENNVPSLRLAEDLDFTKQRQYPLYSFNVPLEKQVLAGL